MEAQNAVQHLYSIQDLSTAFKIRRERDREREAPIQVTGGQQRRHTSLEVKSLKI